VGNLTKEEKVSVVHTLDDKGFFLIKKAAEKLADFLGLSRYSIYNYLNESTH
jgi:predicted transcriptional regulator YheO